MRSVAYVINPYALKAIREKDGHTRASLARAAGISPQYLTDIEQGRRGAKPPTVKALAAALGVPQSALQSQPDPVGAGE